MKHMKDNTFDMSYLAIFVLGLVVFLAGFLWMTKVWFKGDMKVGSSVMCMGIASTLLAASSCLVLRAASSSPPQDFSDMLTFQHGAASIFMSIAWIVLALAVLVIVARKFVCTK